MATADNTETTTMTEGRALLTEREREALAGETSDSYRYKTRSYVRSRLEALEDDVAVLKKNDPELLDELRAVVCPDARERRETPEGADSPEFTVAGGEPPTSERRERPGEPAAAGASPSARRADPLDEAAQEGAQDDADEVARLVEQVVDEVAAGWDDGPRLEDRKAAARAVLEHAVECGHVGKSVAVDRFRDEYPVDGQNAETWWLRNAREVLTEVGDYSRGENEYYVDREDLEGHLADE